MDSILVQWSIFFVFGLSKIIKIMFFSCFEILDKPPVHGTGAVFSRAIYPVREPSMCSAVQCPASQLLGAQNNEHLGEMAVTCNHLFLCVSRSESMLQESLLLGVQKHADSALVNFPCS